MFTQTVSLPHTLSYEGIFLQKIYKVALNKVTVSKNNLVCKNNNYTYNQIHSKHYWTHPISLSLKWKNILATIPVLNLSDNWSSDSTFSKIIPFSSPMCSLMNQYLFGMYSVLLVRPGFLAKARSTLLSSKTRFFNSTGFWISDPSVYATSTTIPLNHGSSLTLWLRATTSASVDNRSVTPWYLLFHMIGGSIQ